MPTFRVREIFPTLQGEGSRAGSPAVFVRFSGCNLWSGDELGRATGLGDCASWCDTDFASGTDYDWSSLADAVFSIALERRMAKPLVVFTGGEPLLQLGTRTRMGDALSMLTKLRQRGFTTAVETNGTRPLPDWLADVLDHVTVSPKALRHEQVDAVGDRIRHLCRFAATDLKVVVPCPMLISSLLEVYPNALLFVQPRDDRDDDLNRQNLELAMRVAAEHGGRVSVQVHKLLGLP